MRVAALFLVGFMVGGLPGALFSQQPDQLGEANKAASVLVMESLNPSCLSVLATTFYRDPSHRRPVHPDTLAFLMEQAGFADLQVVTHSPVAETARLGPLPDLETRSKAILEMRRAIDQRLEKLDHLLFSDQEYHVIGRKP